MGGGSLAQRRIREYEKSADDDNVGSETVGRTSLRRFASHCSNAEGIGALAVAQDDNERAARVVAVLSQILDQPQFAFTIGSSELTGGKAAFAKKEISTGVDILQESAWITWPVACSISWEKFHFCEQCLRCLHGTTVADLVLDIENIPFDAGKISPPNAAYFCSAKCRNAALHNSTPTDDGAIIWGWLDILGGPAGLWRIREASWIAQHRGGTLVFSAPQAVTLESVARFIASVGASYSEARAVLSHAEQARAATLAAMEAVKWAEAFMFPSWDLNCEFDSGAASLFLREVIHENILKATSASFAEAILSRDVVAQIYGKLKLNATETRIWGSDAVSGSLAVLQGGGMYLLQSCFNHSCDPNCTIWSETDDSATVTLTTSRQISEGEELTISYLEAANNVSHELQRQKLREAYGFDCQCTQCRTDKQDRKQQPS